VIFLAYAPVNRPLGGIYRELSLFGIEVTPDINNPAQTLLELLSRLTVNDDGQITVKNGGKLRLEGGAALEVESGAVTLSSNAGTLSKLAGKITTESLSTAAGAAATLTITNTKVAAGDIILLTRNGGTSANGTPVMRAVPGAGSFVITLDNKHASAAFNGTFIIGFLVIKQAA